MALLVIVTFCLLIAGHFLVDFTLQTDTMAREKSYKSTSDLQKMVPWYWWLVAHASEHGLAAGLIVGVMRQSLVHGLATGLSETAAHFYIDWVKCSGRIDINQDQLAHAVCKVWWVSCAFLVPFSSVP